MTAKILSTAMDSVLLELERARMEREDFRQGSQSLKKIAKAARGDMTTPDGGIPIWDARKIRRLTKNWASDDSSSDEAAL